MASWDVNALRITGPLWGESTGSFDIFIDVNLNNMWNKQSSWRWFQASWRSDNITDLHDDVDSTDLDDVFAVSLIKPLE